MIPYIENIDISFRYRYIVLNRILKNTEFFYISWFGTE